MDSSIQLFAITEVFSTNEHQDAFVGSFDGGRQRVPGGLVGISGLDWLTFLFPFDLLKVYAEAELVGPITNPASGPIGMPLRVRLGNPLLNENCYIGFAST